VIFSGAGTATISGSTTFNDFQCTTAGKTLQFASGSTQTITGALTLTGASGNEITLVRSGGAGLDQWNININPGASSSVKNVSVSNSNASGESITAVNSVLGGNNTNWIFETVVDGGGSTGSLSDPYVIPPGTACAVITVNEMINYVSAVVISNGAKVIFKGTMPGFIYLDGILQNHIGQSEIKKYFIQGISGFYRGMADEVGKGSFFGLVPSVVAGWGGETASTLQGHTPQGQFGKWNLWQGAEPVVCGDASCGMDHPGLNTDLRWNIFPGAV